MGILLRFARRRQGHHAVGLRLAGQYAFEVCCPGFQGVSLLGVIAVPVVEGGDAVDHISDITGTDAITVRRIYRKVNPESLSDMAESLAEGPLGPESATIGRTVGAQAKT